MPGAALPATFRPSKPRRELGRKAEKAKKKASQRKKMDGATATRLQEKLKAATAGASDGRASGPTARLSLKTYRQNVCANNLAS